MNSLNTANLDDRLQRLVDGLTHKKSNHHPVLAIKSGDRLYRQVFAAGTAQVDGTPMRPQTPSFTANITKLFIAA